ncbi:PRC-barrel domain-containing protein [Azospirillum rugosum]|uniref:Sporulation protein YlmC with PRC-barrel domain n=1 Tax=Azospirillum rugosum TaxID=416170 RepID=A0ABS4SEK2_9PROT|nr:PRC-barrel domain-containing protein [Azospirillum rugosum]MBP2290996.1 sporulation protein YlmC with PRC-barrel domain [Azospirillum rugosum]MDQ0524940.1 sporulation protein YlmC with PRC-barrel domain [Azospirillum rugosum]
MRRVALPVLSAVILLSLGGCAETSSWFGGSNEQAARPIPQQSLQTASRIEPEAMLGKTVVSYDGQKVGTVDDVLMNRNNRPSELLVSSGGVMGLGAHNVALDIDNVRYSRERDELVATQLTKEQFANLPAYKDDGRMVSLNRQMGK